MRLGHGQVHGVHLDVLGVQRGADGVAQHQHVLERNMEGEGRVGAWGVRGWDITL